jgi:hypothetical protein
VREAAQQTSTVLDDELKRHQITDDEWLKQTTAMLEQEQAAIDEAAQKAPASAALTSNQKLEIARQEQREMAKLTEELVKAQDKAALDEEKQWSAALSFIDGELNSVLSGMLTKHQTWGQEMQSVFSSLAVKAVEELGKIALAEAAIGIGGLLGGPVGAAIGGAGAAAIPSWLPHFDTGALELLGDTLAMVHRGEMVVPSGPASTLREVLSGGGSIGGGSTPGAGKSVNITRRLTSISIPWKVRPSRRR